jgi:uncharacterized RDD family membrane protein YckC
MTDAPAAPADVYTPPAHAESSAEPISPIAGFWRRLGAFCIDAIVLGLIGLLIGLFAADALSRVVWLARGIGFAIALLYAGLLNSRIAGGQTIGKRALGIRVESLDGTLLSLPRALARQIVFSLPFFLNNAPFNAKTMVSWPMVPISLIVFGGAFAIVYLFVFNRRNRRSLHDLAVGSVVVRTPPAPVTLPIPPVWRAHLIVVAVVAALSLLAPMLGQQLLKTETFSGMMPLFEKMSAEPGVLNAQVNIGSTYGTGGNHTYVAVTLKRDRPVVEDEDFARAVALDVLRVYPQAAKTDAISVTLVYGYDMVIASRWTKYTYAFRPSDLGAPK